MSNWVKIKGANHPFSQKNGTVPYPFAELNRTKPNRKNYPKSSKTAVKDKTKLCPKLTFYNVSPNFSFSLIQKGDPHPFAGISGAPTLSQMWSAPPPSVSTYASKPAPRVPEKTLIEEQTISLNFSSRCAVVGKVKHEKGKQFD
jgi:hypothetical protein